MGRSGTGAGGWMRALGGRLGCWWRNENMCGSGRRRKFHACIQPLLRTTLAKHQRQMNIILNERNEAEHDDPAAHMHIQCTEITM